MRPALAVPLRLRLQTWRLSGLGMGDSSFVGKRKPASDQSR